jgi:predicted AlkP superfamily pyrophosphatase or phosphodiesterase
MSALSGHHRHLIVISADALSEDNWEAVNRLPNISGLIAHGSHTRELESVFPTLTYVVHTTMVTGLYPDKHEVIHNNQFQPFVPENEQTWYWYRDSVRGPTLYDLARQHGLSTAGVMWPVSGKSSMKYNLPEIVAIKGENQALKVLSAGNFFYCLGLELRHGKIRRGINQPELDDFVAACAVDTITRKKPNLLLIHLIDLDDAKHRYGTKSIQVDAALSRLDRRVGEIIAATKEAGIYDQTSFVLLGDHGQIDIQQKVRLNNLLRGEGLIHEDKGNMCWQAYLQSAGGSAYLYAKDSESERRAVEVLTKAMQDESYGIGSILTRAELDSLRATNSVNYALEAKLGYSFDDSLENPTVENLEELGITYATHGYSPHRPEYKCIFIASGATIARGKNFGPMDMVDVAPTLARILGLDFYPCDGKAVALTT